MTAISNKTKVSFSVINCICYDQRVLKIADTVSSLNCDITIIGRKKAGCCTSDAVPFRTKRFKMIFNKGFLFYKFFNIRLFFYLLFNSFDLLVANDLDTLLPNYLISKLKRIPLIYDSHEYFTEVPEIQNRVFVKKVWQTIEKAIFPHLKFVTTVSESIALSYERAYGVMPLVVRNAGKNSDHITPFSRTEINIPTDDLLIILQGTGINIDKGAEELIEAVFNTEGVTLMIVGSGDVLPQLKELVTRLNINHRVKFIATVPWETLMKYTRMADIGMILEKDTNLNYRYSLPNKLFDFIAGGIPVIASELPETCKIINEYGIGIIIGKVTPDLISGALRDLKTNLLKLAELKKHSAEASLKINWLTESEKIRELYKKVLSLVNK